jgi:hypothetical protein
MNGFAAYNPVAGVQLAAYAAVGLRESLLSMAAISLFPPGSLYRSPALATVTLTLALTRTPALILALARPTPTLTRTLTLTRACASLTVTRGTARSATRGGSRAPRTSRRCVAWGVGQDMDMDLGHGGWHGAWGMGRGAWGMKRGAWGVRRGAWGVRRGAWGVGRGACGVGH